MEVRGIELKWLCPSKIDLIYWLRIHHLSLKSYNKVSIFSRIQHVAFRIAQQYSFWKGLYSTGMTNRKGLLYLHVNLTVRTVHYTEVFYENLVIIYIYIYKMFRESFDGNNLLLVMLFYKNLSFLLNKKSICNQCSQLFSFNCFF